MADSGAVEMTDCNPKRNSNSSMVENTLMAMKNRKSRTHNWLRR